MEFKDYYATLGVSKSASEKEIKQAFRKLARKHHPDVNPGDKASEAKFKEINEAYEVLGDPEKRRKYDELGANWRMYEQAQQQGQGWPGGAPGGGFGGFGGADPGGGGAWTINMGGPGGYRTMNEDEMRDMFGTEDPFSDFFRTFFGRGGGGGTGEPRGRAGRQSRSQRGRDLEQEVDLTLEEAYHGAMRRIGIDHGGQTRTVDVRIPAGVKAGTRVRAAGEGEPGSNGGRGRRPVPSGGPSASRRLRAARGRPPHQGPRARHHRRAGGRGAGPDRDGLGPVEGAGDDAGRTDLSAERPRHADRRQAGCTTAISTPRSTCSFPAR